LGEEKTYYQVFVDIEFNDWLDVAESVCLNVKQTNKTPYMYTPPSPR